jgi:hypothetical protein
MWTWFSVSDWQVQPLPNRLTLRGIHAILGDSAIGLATGWTSEESRVRVSVGSRIVSSPKCPGRLLGPTQPPIQWVTGALSRSKAAGAWNLPLISSECRGQENADLYIHCPISLRGLVYGLYLTLTVFLVRKLSRQKENKYSDKIAL